MKFDDIMVSPNIAEDLDEDLLREIGVKAVDGFERDLDSRADWEQRNAEALKLALQVREGKSYPWPNAANVHYPLVTVACMQYNARAYPALIPNSKLVKHRVVGKDEDGSKTARAKRVSSHMNYQLTVQDEPFEEGFDRLLMTEPLLGCSFEKSYFNGEHNVNEHVTPEYFVVDYYTKSLDECRRQTHIIPKHKNQIVEKMRLGEWVEYDLTEKMASTDKSEMSSAMDEARGVTEPDSTEDTPFIVLEQHCYLDLDEDGYDEPYIVTVLKETREVLRIKPRFQPENVLFNQRGQVAKIKPDTYFTKFGFIPSPDGGFYDIGFGILLSPMNESVNTIINQLIDAGTLSNLQSGFISKNVRIADGRAQFTPGEWKKVNATGDDLRKGIMPLPVREPSQTLMALLGVLIEAGQKIGSVSEMMMGENPGQNQPAMTTMNVLEQGLKVYSAIIKRNHRSLKAMFRKMYKLNALYLNPEEYFEVVDEQPPQAQAGQPQQDQEQGIVFQQDYFGDPKDITPVSDPSIISDAQRLAKAETVLGRAQANPVMYNVYEAERRYLEAIQEPGIDSLLLPQDQIQPPVDEEMELEKAKFQHQVGVDNFNMELKAQETMINMKKKIADTERSLATVENMADRQNLEEFKAVSEDELRRAELLVQTLREKSEGASRNVEEVGS